MKSLFLLFAFFFVLEAVVVQVPLVKRSMGATQLAKRAKFLPLAHHPKGRAVQAKTPGRLVTFEYTNDFFTTNITLGTPAKTFTVVVDQTDYQFWVLDQAYFGEHTTQHFYNANDSSTSKVVDTSYYSDYIGGVAQGFTIQDSFSLQGLKVDGQTFGSVTYLQQDEDVEISVDGILGLTGSDWGFDSPLGNLIDQLDAPLYTIWIGPHVPPSQGTIQGALTLGGFDNEHCGPVAVQVAEYERTGTYVFNISQVDIGSYSRAVDFNAFQDVSLPFLGIPYTEYWELYLDLLPNYDYTYNQFTCTLVLTTYDDDSFWLGVPFTTSFCAQVDIWAHAVGFAPVKAQ
ncbi:Peptidase A1 domain-containing protein [Aphelenchoides fujianensis]|nr:Peptidase A1 domain-containing protein [Aphelenchoides fujianensis]